MTPKYDYTRDGAKAFLNSVLDEAMSGDYHNIFITVGDHEIEIPLYPETYECLEEILDAALTVEEEGVE